MDTQEMLSKIVEEQIRKSWQRYETDNRAVASAIFQAAKRRGLHPAFGLRKDGAEHYCIRLWGTRDEMHRAVMAGWEAVNTATVKAQLEAVGQGHLLHAGAHLKGYVR